jgi:hypothetical protein
MASRKVKPKPKTARAARAAPRTAADPSKVSAGPAPAAAAESPAQSAGMPEPEDVWRLRMEFAMGAVLNTSNMLGASGCPPQMVAQAMLRGAGMVIEALNLANGISATEEVALGRQRQAAFRASMSQPPTSPTPH